MIFTQDIVVRSLDFIDDSELNEAVKKAQDEIVGNIGGLIVVIVIGALVVSGVGIILAAIIGIAAAVLGTAVAQAVVEDMPLFIWIKRAIDLDSKLNEKKPEIVAEIKGQLASDAKLKESILQSGRQLIRGAVMKKVAIARTFIE